MYNTIYLLLLLAPIDLLSQDGVEQPNIIFFMTDDQGYADVGYLGHPVVKTPYIDEMARSGLRLDRFYASPVCSPTRASVLTGRYPTRTGTLTWGHALRPQEQTVISHLKEAGYQTGLFGKWHLGSVRSEGSTSPEAHGFEVWAAAPNFYMNDPWMSINGTPAQLKGEGSAVTVGLALEFIEEATKSNEPFIAFIWTGAPHLPHEAMPYLSDLYSDQPDNLKNYYGEISGIDQAVGRVRDRLRELEIADETLLWFTSDNGGKLPEANNGEFRGEKGELWEGGIRVPSVIEWPGVIEPGISMVPTAMVDLFPTFLDLAGKKSQNQEIPLDGISLMPLFNGDNNQREKPLGFWSYSGVKGQKMASDDIMQELQKYQNGDLSLEELNEGLIVSPDLPYEGIEQYPNAAAWMDGNWKLHSSDGTATALFNLADDPGEVHNLLEQNPERAKAMLEELLNWQDSVIHSIRGGDYAEK
ncbi:MAG: sulfatase-like hydrolase/transferase [Balneolales bacterium]